MKSIQLWLPLFGRGIGFAETFRDMQRALSAWDCDHRIWMLPELEEPARWPEKGKGTKAFIRALPGETLECLDIYHVGENGYVYGAPHPDRFPTGRIDGLLDAWLQWPSTNELNWQNPPTLTVAVPEIVGDKVAYRRRTFRVPIVPLIEEPPDGAMLPARLSRAATISPETELTEALRRKHGPLRVTDRGNDLPPLMVSDRDPSVRYQGASLLAPPPLAGFFPAGVTLDALFHCMRMYRVVEQSKVDPVAALHQANTAATPYLSTGPSTRAFTWYAPTLMELQDPTAVIQRAATLGLNDVKSFSQLHASELWRKQMTEYVPVRRAWGPIGLFWALLIERLEAGQPMQLCERCGRSLRGKRGKRMCGADDNPECYRDRRSRDRRLERQREQAARKSRTKSRARARRSPA